MRIGLASSLKMERELGVEAHSPERLAASLWRASSFWLLSAKTEPRRFSFGTAGEVGAGLMGSVAVVVVGAVVSGAGLLLGAVGGLERGQRCQCLGDSGCNSRAVRHGVDVC